MTPGRDDPLSALALLAPGEFAQRVYETILGRAPTSSERDAIVSSLMNGETRTWLAGALRFGPEGRARAVAVPGLRARYLAQRIFRWPVVGAVLQWINALVGLPSALRYIRATQQRDVELATLARRHDLEAAERTRVRMADLEAAAKARQRDRVDLETRIGQLHDELRALRSAVEAGATAVAARVSQIEARADAIERDLGRSRDEHASLRAKVEPILPPPIGDTLEVVPAPLAARALEQRALGADTMIDALPADERYALFESVFYDAAAVLAKQRVYLPYLDRQLTASSPFLDLGCGRGEFLHILRDDGVRVRGVDVNGACIFALRERGFDVVHDDLVAFLERDRESYAGASLLQVAEHLSWPRIERVLTLLRERIVDGGLLIVETPNPLSPFALGVFHTDPTHVAPLPPEAMRYAVEAAGFRDARILYQARIPHDQFAGPDPRAYYADYAIIATRRGGQ